jgi:hypothetical protein
MFKLVPKRKWILLAYIAFLLVSSELFLAFGNMWINLVINTIVFISFALLFSGNLTARLIFSALIYTMSIVADGLSFLALNYIFYIQRGTEIPVELMQTAGRTLVNIIFLPILLITMLFFRRIFAENAFQKHLKIPKSYTVSILAVIAGIVLINVLFISAAADDFQVNAIKLSISLLVSAMVILLIIWFYNTMLNHLKMLEESRLRDHMLERWEIQYNAARDSQKVIAGINHNLRYNFLTLSGFLKNDEVEKAQKHIEDHIGQLSYIVSTGNISIDAMLNYYQQRIKDVLNIEMKSELLIPPDMKLDSTHIVTILGNAIENAMEACEQVEQDSRYIHLKASITAKNALLINIINPYLVSPITDNDGNLITTKADKRNHGLGLVSISEIIPEEKGQVHFEFADNVFKFMAVFYDIIE